MKVLVGVAINLIGECASHLHLGQPAFLRRSNFLTAEATGPANASVPEGEIERPLQFPELAARACWTLAVGAFDSISTFFS
jgi:hypothetical protein